jgi:hypothetical protein
MGHLLHLERCDLSTFLAGSESLIFLIAADNEGSVPAIATCEFHMDTLHQKLLLGIRLAIS